MVDHPDHIWAAMRRRVAFWETDRFGFAFNDPAQFSDEPANPEVLTTVLEHLTDRESKLNEHQMVKLLSHFAASCTEEEWHDFYQPVLKKEFDFGITLGDYNAMAPTEWVAKPFLPQPQSLPPSKIGSGLAILIEPDWIRCFAIIHEDRVEALGEGFQTWDFPLLTNNLKRVCGEPAMGYPVALEVYTNGYGAIITDAFPVNQVGNYPTEIRMLIVSSIYHRCFDEVEMGYPTTVYPADIIPFDDDFAQIREYAKETGHEDCTILVKTNSSSYLEPAYRIT